MVGRAGFEPAKVKPADLQSALVGRLSIFPFSGAKVRTFFLLCKFLYVFFQKLFYLLYLYPYISCASQY